MWPSRVTFNCVGEKMPLYNGVSSESIISLARHGEVSLPHVERERKRERISSSSLQLFMLILHHQSSWFIVVGGGNNMICSPPFD